LSDSEQIPAADSPPILTLIDGRRLAFLSRAGKETAKTGLVFLGGFKSDMKGTKAEFLDQYAELRGLAFLRFDYTGHGDSSGNFIDGTMGAWLQDTLDMFDRLTQGPQIVVGSSMGGWLMLLLALARPERIRALIGVAAAPDFTEDLIWDALQPQHRETLMRVGRLSLPSEYDSEPDIVTRALIEDGRCHLMLRKPIPIRCPVRLLHGMMDASVPFGVSMTLAEKLAGDDVVVTLIKNGDHRLSQPRDLALLGATLDEFFHDPAANKAANPAR
jgi:pimeloyl-ACP methyl ester carboxylesterase